MSHEVTWIESTDLGGASCVVQVKLMAEKGKRDFLTAMDRALEEAEEIFCQDFERRTGKTL